MLWEARLAPRRLRPGVAAEPLVIVCFVVHSLVVLSSCRPAGLLLQSRHSGWGDPLRSPENNSARYGSVAKLSYKGRKITLLKPSTYMNLSGNAVRYWIQKIKLPLANVIVICDDLNLPFGTVRMRMNGSDGGHKGLKSIQECLGTKLFARIRIGIGNDFHPGEQVDYVLGELSPEQEEQIARTGLRIRDGIQTFCTAGPDFAMNFLNSKPQNQEND